MILRLAMIKVYPVKGDLQANFSRLQTILTDIAPHRPDVVITPEGFLDGYVATEETVSRETLTDYAIDPDFSAYTKDIAAWAAARQAWLILGCARLAANGAYNSALIFNRHGRRIGHYDKTHCQTHDQKYLPGRRLPVFESDFGLFGVMICADRRWPETVRTLALKGARVVFNPTYGMHDERNLHMMQTRSYESEIFIAFTHPGQALVTGPSGEIITNNIDPAQSFLLSQIDLAKVDAIRSREHSHLKDRRPDVYDLT